MKRFLSVMFAACMALCMFADGVTYSVNVPEGTNQCYLYGEATGNTFLRMKKASDGTYSVTVPTANITLTYNYASGNGEQYREVKSDGKDVDPRTYKGSDIVSAWKAVAPADGLDPQDPVEPQGLTFSVTVPEGTPAVYVAGNFNEWSFTAMTKVNDTHYTLTVENLSATGLEYKYTCGNDWKYVELTAEGGEVANRSYNANDVVAKWKEVPSVTPPQTETVYYITGESLVGSWNPDALQLGEGFTKDLAAGEYAFKITINGVWEGALGYDARGTIAEGVEAKSDASGNLVIVLSQAGRVTITVVEGKINVAFEAGQEPPVEPTDLVFNVTVPEGTPAVYVAGNFNEWSFTAMTKVNDTHYTLTVENLSATGLEYKYTCGEDWKYVELTAEGGEVANRSYNANDVVAKWKEVPGAGPVEPGDGLTFSVTVPEGTPAVYVAGTFNEWSFTALTKVDDTHYTLTVENLSATGLKYKYTCGEDWKYVEVNADGTDIEDRSYNANDVVAKWKEVPGAGPVEPGDGLTFSVTVPEGTPAVYVAGTFNEWSFTALTKVDDTHYTLTVENLSATGLEYKYTCGEDWKYVEVTAEGGEVANRSYNANDVVAKWKEVPGAGPVEPGDGLTFNVTVPEGTPAVYVAGNFNEWSFAAMTKVDDTHYTLTVKDLAAEGLEYKYTCGEDWKYVELTAEGGEVANRSYNANDVVAKWKEVPGSEPVFTKSELVTFGEANVAEYASTTTFGSLIVSAADAAKVSVDANTKKYDDLAFTHRLKLGGAGNATGRVMKANVIGACTIHVYALSSSSSADRTLNLDLNSFVGNDEGAVHTQTFPVRGKVEEENRNVELLTYEYKGEGAASLYIYSASGGINIYGFEVKYEETPQPGEGLTFKVTVPEGTPAVYVAGNFNEWSFAAMTKVDDTHYTLTVKDLAAEGLEYKYTCGEDWKYVEVTAEGEEVANRSYNANDVVAKWKEVPGAGPVEPGEGLTFNVTVPEGTPAVYVAGNFNEWSFAAMTKVDDTHYTLTVKDLAAEGLEYKYTCGADWKYVELTAEGGDVANRSYNANDVVAKWKEVPGAGPVEPGESVTFNVTVPEGTPAVYVAGNFNEWSFAAMTKVDDTHYTLTVENISATGLKYKYTCGESWDYVEKDENGNELADRTYNEADVVARWNKVPSGPVVVGVTYNVTVPEGTPAVYISGTFNGWTFTEMEKVDDTHYTITIENATTDNGYKYLCGPDWKFEETDQVDNRTYSENDVVKGWKDIPQEPITTTYYITGETIVGGWAADQQAMENGSIVLHLAAGTYQFKITDGSWDAGHNWGGDVVSSAEGAEVSKADDGNVIMVLGVESDVTITFDGTNITIKAVPSDPSGLNNSTILNYWVENSTLNVNLVGAQRVMMFDVNGRMVDNRMSNDFYQIQLPAGVYMLRVDSSVVKVAIR